MPANGWYLSSKQLEQDTLPAAVLYFPGMHPVHVCPSLPVYPLLHLQSVAIALPASDCDGWLVTDRHVVQTLSVLFTDIENSLTGQLSHNAVPTVVLYFPATHPVHKTPLLPVYPALHMQSVTWSLASGDCMYLGHPRHKLLVAAPTVEYVSGKQFVHAADPLLILNVPATHAVHV